MTLACTLLPRPFRPRIWGTLLTALASLLPASAQFDSSTGGNNQSAPSFRPLPIFFPPNPPPLGRLVTKLSIPTNAPGQRNAPPELATHLYEPFYAPLSTHLWERKISDRLRRRLDLYRTERAALLTELRATIERSRGDEPAARRVALTTLASQQAVRLGEQETAAEQLRADLATGEYDWSALRDWRIGGRNTRGDSPVELASVLRAYAYYQAGLAPAQRRLLREISIELVSGAEDATTAAQQQQFLFFSPELARVKLPDHIPAEVAGKVATFETKKSALKKELFDAVVAQDGATFAFTRTGALKTLAEKQAAGFTALEQVADEIRDGLVIVPDLAPPAPRSPLPPQLTQRVVAALEGRAALVRESRARIDTILARVPEGYPVTFSYTLDNEGIKVRPIVRRGRSSSGSASPTEALTNTVVADLKLVGDDHKVRSDEISRDVESLREDIGRHLGGNAKPLAIDEVIDGVVRYHVAAENEDAYRDYRAAMLEPGLSAPQRRLLFAAALERLELPLPRGELQPTRRPAGW